MSTQIIDNFQLNVAKPIDSRMVTQGTQSRNDLQFKYEGLRVYDKINKAPYVYIDSDWVKENETTGATVPSGTVNKLLKYITSNTVGDSAIVDIGTFLNPNIGIGKVPGNNIALDVNGEVKASNFSGYINGKFIDISSITNDKLSPYISDNTLIPANSILKTTTAGNISWISDINTTVVVNKDTSTTLDNSGNVTQFLVFTSTPNGSVTPNSLLANNYSTSKAIGVLASTSQLLGSGDTANDNTAPAYAFTTNKNSGLYGKTGVVGLSLGGNKVIEISSGLLNITTNTTNISGILTVLGQTTLNAGAIINGTTTLNGNTSVSGTTTLNSSLSVSGVSTLKDTFIITNQTNSFGLAVSNNGRGGILISSNGEFLRSVQNSGINYNYMSFYNPGNTTRRGYLGYGSPSGDDFFIMNETSTGAIRLYTNNTERLNISNTTFKISTGLTDLTDTKIKALSSNNEFNFINDDSFNSNTVYINYRGASTNGITGYRFNNGKSNGGLATIYVSDVNSVNGSFSGNVNVNGIVDVRNGFYNNLYYGSSAWRIHDGSLPGMGIFYQTITNGDEFVWYITDNKGTNDGDINSLLKAPLKIKTDSSSNIYGGVQMENGASIGNGGFMKSHLAGCIKFTYNWNAQAGFYAYDAKGGVSYASKIGSSGDDLTVTTNLPTNFVTSDANCVVTASWGNDSDWDVVQRVSIKGYISGNSLAFTLWNFSAMDNGSGQYQIDFVVTQLA